MAEAELAIRHGATALGLVSEMPSGPGVIDEATIARVAAAVPDGVETFLLTARTDPLEIADQVKRLGSTAVQLVDRLPPNGPERLREALTDTAIVQVVHVVDEAAIDEALAAEPFVDYLLLDSGDPGRPVKELGGTGRRHDWTVSRRIVEAVGTPVYLAGGLRPDNVAEAIRTVGPYGLDLCTGVRRAGRLDEKLLSAFMRAVTAVAA